MNSDDIASGHPVARRIFALLLLGLGLQGFAAAQTADFEKQISAFERLDVRFPPPERAIVVVGSSTIRLWTSVRNDLAPLEIVPRGFGSSTADDLDYYLDRVVLPYAPRAVVIYEGDHDLQIGQTPEQVIAFMTQVVQRIGIAFPETRLYLISVKPSPKFWGLWPQSVVLNQMIVNLCLQTPQCTYIDTASALLGSNGKFVRSYYRGDRIHLNDVGYQIWTAVVDPVLMSGEAAEIALPELRSNDVGAVAIPGSLTSGIGSMTVQGSGAGFVGSNDGFHFAWRQLTGNGQITARIAVQPAASGGPMAGVMLREQLTAGARHAFAYVSPGGGAGMLFRSVAGADALPGALPDVDASAPYWLRIVRKYGTVICYLSANGISWTECGRTTIAGLKKTVYVGLAISSAVDGETSTATFDNVYIHGSTAFPSQ